MSPITIPNFISKYLSKYTSKSSLRPGIGGRGVVNSTGIQPSLDYAYRLEQEVSIFSDVVLKLKQEMFRRGFIWEPTFTLKCLDCNAEYDDPVDECECGSTNLIEPDKSQIQYFDNADSSFIESANYNYQSLIEVLTDFEFNLNVGDNAYLLLPKAYEFDNEGNIISSSPKEILSIDPRDLKKIFTPDGFLGGRVWVCPRHRNESSGTPGKRCKICGAIMQDAIYETTHSTTQGGTTGGKIYYLRDEVIHSPKYYHSVLYGFPPILKILDTAMAYHYLEERVRNFYERGRPPGLLTFPTNNQEALIKMWDYAMIKLEEDKYHIPVIGYDSAGKAAASFLKLMEDPNPAMLEVKKELRERIGSRFGVSLIFQGDTSASGGLNNEGLQITVTNRAVEDGQKIYNEKVLPWLCQQFGITDYVLQLNPSEEADEMAEKDRLSRDISNAKGMWEMGFDVEYNDGVFEYSGESKPQQDTDEDIFSDSGGDEGEQPTFPGLKLSLNKAECPSGQHRHSGHDYCHPESRVHQGDGDGDSGVGNEDVNERLKVYKNELRELSDDELKDQIGVIEEAHPAVSEQLNGWYTGNDMGTFDEKVSQIFKMNLESSRNGKITEPLSDDEKEGYMKIYMSTQEYLKRQGDNKIIVQRGLRSHTYERFKDLESGEKVDLEQYNISSWSNDYDVAVDFAQQDESGSVVVETYLSVNRVFMHPDIRSPNVHHGEGEVVIMGSKIDSVIAEIFHPENEEEEDW